MANFAWFAAYKAQWKGDVTIISALASRLLDEDVLAASCSAKGASRLLGSFSVLCEPLDGEQTDASAGLLARLFEAYGEHLLSVQLTPMQATTAIYGYARASYGKDIAIFDYLAESIAAQVARCTTRQLAMSLWSCGKMVVWDSEDEVSSEMPLVSPRFATSATLLLKELCLRSDKLNAKDVGQTIWAMARLQLNEPSCFEVLGKRAEELVADMTTTEIANVLWAVSILSGKKAYRIVFVLTRRLLSPDETLDGMDIREASAVLFALAKLNIRDEELFQKLVVVVMRSIDSASSRTVSNVLWAHRCVHLEPPQKVLDAWAAQKLGLSPVFDPE